MMMLDFESTVLLWHPMLLCEVSSVLSFPFSQHVSAHTSLSPLHSCP